MGEKPRSQGVGRVASKATFPVGTRDAGQAAVGFVLSTGICWIVVARDKIVLVSFVELATRHVNDLLGVTSEMGRGVKDGLYSGDIISLHDPRLKQVVRCGSLDGSFRIFDGSGKKCH